MSVSTLLKNIGVKTSCLALLLGISYLFNQAQAEEKTCQLDPQENRVIVNFNNRLYGNRSRAQAMSEDIKTNLTPGHYQITLQSYDKRSRESDPSHQPSERWHAILSNPEGKTITTSSSITDIPDDQDFIIETTDENLLVSEPVSEVTAFHSAYPAQGPNSVTSVCAAFDFIKDPTAPSTVSTETPTPVINPAPTTPVTAKTGSFVLPIIITSFISAGLVVTVGISRLQNY